MGVLDFDRTDHLVIRAAGIAAIVVVPVLTVGVRLLAWVTGGAVKHTVVFKLENGAEPKLSSGVSAQWTEHAELTVSHPSVTDRLTDLGPALIIALASAGIGWAVLRLAKGIRRRDAFTAESLRQLRVIGLVLLIAPWLHLAFSALADAVLAHSALPDQDGFSLSLMPGGAVIAISALGLTVALLAEAFKQGRDLSAETEGLV